MNAPQLDLLVQPNWKSVGNTLGIEIGGEYVMRNGHRAIVKRYKEIEYIEGMTRRSAKFPIWIGVCLCCDTPVSWNLDGSYAAIGRHDFDLVRRAA